MMASDKKERETEDKQWPTGVYPSLDAFRHPRLLRLSAVVYAQLARVEMVREY
jgi:hypothetical protein